MISRPFYRSITNFYIAMKILIYSCGRWWTYFDKLSTQPKRVTSFLSGTCNGGKVEDAPASDIHSGKQVQYSIRRSIYFLNTLVTGPISVHKTI